MYFVDLRISGFIHREMAIFWLSFLIKLGAFLGLKCPFLGFTIQRGGSLHCAQNRGFKYICELVFVQNRLFSVIYSILRLYFILFYYFQANYFS